MGKNNLLAAQAQLLEERGLDFNLSYARWPFFLRRDLAEWHASRGTGLPTDATRGEVFEAMGWKEKGGDGRIGALFKNVGLTPYWGAQEADTMDSHRLAWHAARQSSETGERMWRALSERYFEGKHTQIRPIRLDSHALLLECAEEAGLDREDAQRVLTSGDYEDEVRSSFEDIQKMGVNSIPVVIFQVDAAGVEGRTVHHGSGSAAEFRSVLERLHASYGSVSADAPGKQRL